MVIVKRNPVFWLALATWKIVPNVLMPTKGFLLCSCLNDYSGCIQEKHFAIDQSMFFHCGGGGWVVGGIGITLFLDFTVPYNNSIQITFSPILIHTHIMPLTLGLPNHGSCFLLLWLLQSQAGVIVLGSWEEGLRQCGAHLYLLINIILILSWIFRFISWEKWLQIELAQKTGGSTSVVYPVTPLFTRYLLCLLNWIIYCLMKFLGLSGGGMGEWLRCLTC